jgi:hypothetical protein
MFYIECAIWKTIYDVKKDRESSSKHIVSLTQKKMSVLNTSNPLKASGNNVPQLHLSIFNGVFCI